MTDPAQKKLEIKWATVFDGSTLKRYEKGFDTDNMGFDRSTGSFLVESPDGSVTSYWNCPVVMHQEVVDDNSVDFDKGWE